MADDPQIVLPTNLRPGGNSNARPSLQPRTIYRQTVVKYVEPTLCGLWTFFYVALFLAVVLVPLIVLIAQTPDSGSMARTVHDGTCGVGEHFDDQMQECAPNLYLPVPVDNRLVDNTVGACEGFFRHACGTWIDDHRDQSYVARAFSYIAKENRYEVEQIVKNAPLHSPLRRFYDSCMDTLVIQSPSSRTETRHEMATKLPGALRSHEEVLQQLHKLQMAGYSTLFWFSVEQHPTEPTMVIMARANRDLIKELPTIGPLTRLYEQLHGKGSSRAREMAMQLQVMIYTLKKSLDQPSSGDEEDYIHYVLDGRLQKDLLSIEVIPPALKEVYPLLTNVSRVWVPSDDHAFFEFFQLRRFSLEQWRALLQYSVLRGSHDFLPKLPQDVYFRRHNPLRRRIYHHLELEEQSADQDTCIQATKHLLPGLVAEQYLQQYFPGEATRDKIIEVVENIRDRYAVLLGNTKWMDAETRQRAVEKVRSIIVRAVHPNQWQPEPFAKQISKDRYLHNLNLIRRYRVQQNLALWNLRGDRDASSRFAAPLSTVNAWYSPSTNTITIFAGILRYPFYHPKYHMASLYATIGMVAGHELAHAMDSQGVFFDKEGSLRRWFSPLAEKEFQIHADCIKAEYEAPEDCPNEKYSEQTLGEDIADILGIRMAYEAYFMNPNYSQEEKTALGVHQHFFFSFAQNWCERADKDVLCDRVSNDVHAIASYRVDKTLRNIEYFQQAFNCPADSAMVNQNKCVIYG